MDNERYAVRKKLWDIFCEAKKVFERPWCWNFFYDNDTFKLVKVCKRQDSITFSDWILNFGYHGYHGYIDYPDYLEKWKFPRPRPRNSLYYFITQNIRIPPQGKIVNNTADFFPEPNDSNPNIKY